jgi:hypothetical protein
MVCAAGFGQTGLPVFVVAFVFSCFRVDWIMTTGDGGGVTRLRQDCAEDANCDDKSVRATARYA